MTEAPVPDDLVLIPPQSRRRWIFRPYGFLLPALVVMVPLVFVPCIWAALVSVQDYDAFERTGKFIWLGNFVSALSGPLFLRAVLHTLYFDAVFVPGTLLVSSVLAILLHWRRRRGALLEAVLYASFFVSLVASGIAWRTRYRPDGGLINGLLMLAGCEPVDFLHEPHLVLPSIAIMNIWRWFPICTVILYAGLRRIPGDVREQALIDGATRFGVTRHVTFPMMRRPGMICAVLLIVISLRGFEDVYVMSRDGGPATWAITVPFLMYRTSIEQFDLGPAMSIAIMLAFIIGLFVFLLFAMCKSHFVPARGGRVPEKDATPNGHRHFYSNRAGACTSIAIGLALTVGTIAALVPLYALVSTAMNPSGDWAWGIQGLWPKRWDASALAGVLGGLGGGRALLNGLLVAVPAAAVGLVVCTPAAYAMGVKSFFGGASLRRAVILAAAVSPILYIAGTWRVAAALHLWNTRLVVFLIMLAHPMVILALKAYIRSLPPDMLDAARLDGLSDIGILKTVVLPLIRRGLVAAGVMLFVIAWNTLSVPLALVNSSDKQMPAAFAAELAREPWLPWPQVASAALLTALPVLAVFLLCHRLLLGEAADWAEGKYPEGRQNRGQG